jgi:hypothetical protein
VEIKLGPKSGILVAVIALAIVGVRFATLGETDDPELREAVVSELTIRLGGRTGADLDAIERAGGATAMDETTARRLVDRADASGIQVHSMAVSRPVMSAGTREEVVVRVEYSLPEASPRREYWLFDHSALGGWRYRYTTTALSYYLNVF